MDVKKLFHGKNRCFHLLLFSTVNFRAPEVPRSVAGWDSGEDFHRFPRCCPPHHSAPLDGRHVRPHREPSLESWSRYDERNKSFLRREIWLGGILSTKQKGQKQFSVRQSGSRATTWRQWKLLAAVSRPASINKPPMERERETESERGLRKV